MYTYFNTRHLWRVSASVKGRRLIGYLSCPHRYSYGRNLKNLQYVRGYRPNHGATENAGVENAIRAKLQGWKMQEWKM